MITAHWWFKREKRPRGERGAVHARGVPPVGEWAFSKVEKKVRWWCSEEIGSVRVKSAPSPGLPEIRLRTREALYDAFLKKVCERKPVVTP